MKSRISFVKYIFLIFLLLLAGKVFAIQKLTGDEYSQAAAAQRLRSTKIYTERGDILDRNGIKFTGRENQCIAVIQPAELLKDASAMKRASELL